MTEQAVQTQRPRSWLRTGLAPRWRWLAWGLFALAWQERSLRFRRDAAAFVRFLAKPDLHARLAARRDALLAEMRALAALVPDAALERPGR